MNVTIVLKRKKKKRLKYVIKAFPDNIKIVYLPCLFFFLNDNLFEEYYT